MERIDVKAEVDPLRPSKRAWSEEDVRTLLERHEFTYQKVKLPFDLETGGDDRSPTARAILPEDLSGKSLFDVGCCYGYFCFEAEERGAAQADGADIDADNIAKCRLLADCRGSNAVFHHLDIEREPLPGTFDYVLCLNVLHHLRNPLLALDRLIEATRECLVLEVAPPSFQDARKLGWGMMLASPLLRLLPAMFLAGAGRTAASQTFFFTRSSLRALLKAYRMDIASVDFMASEQKNRFIALARRRRFKTLVIVAGAHAESTAEFIADVRGRRIGLDLAAMGIDDVGKLSFADYDALAETDSAPGDAVVLTYAITKSITDGDLHRFSHGLLDLINVAGSVRSITLWQPSSMVRDRMKAAEAAAQKGLAFGGRARKKRRKLAALYEDDRRYENLYREWFAFIEAHGNRHLVVMREQGNRASTIEEWRAAHGAGAR
jgi:SAM-dependent methyltransferase